MSADRRPARIRSAPMRVLVVTNFEPDAARPAARPLGPRPGRGDARARGRGRALQLPARLAPVRAGDPAPAAAAARRALRPRPRPLRPGRLVRPRSPAREPLLVTFHGTDVRHRSSGRSRAAWPGASTSSPPSRAPSSRPRTGGPGCPRVPGSAVLPCGPDLARFRPIRASRRGASSASTPTAATCSSPPTPRGRRSATTAPPSSPLPAGAELLTGGSIDPDADAALGQRRQRGPRHLRLRGLRARRVEALACDVPVLSTPVGIAPFALAGVAGALCAPFDAGRLAGGRPPPPRRARPPGRGRRPRRNALRGADGRTHDRGLPRRLGLPVIDLTGDEL